MRLSLMQLPKLIVRRQSSAIFGLIIIVMTWSGVALKYLGDVYEDTREAERTIRNFTLVFEENVLRSIGEIDKALLYLRRIVETRNEPTNFYNIVQSADILSDIILQAAIVDADGIIRWTNARPETSPLISVADREHIQVQLNSKADKLFISKPVIGRASGQWSVQFTRRFLRNDGTIAGVVVASLNPGHFTAFYDKIDLGPSASISMIGNDGLVRSSGGTASGFVLGEDLNGTKLFSQIFAGANVLFNDTSTAGEPLVIAVRKVKDHPLWVSVSVRQAEIYKSSLATLQINITAAIALSFLTFAAMERILRTEARAQHKAAQLQLTLENISQGIMLVTKELEVPIINKRCAELLGLPEELIIQAPKFDTLKEYQNRLGLLRQGALATQAIDNLEPGQIEIVECKTPRGAVLEIRSGPLPGGGFVQTFTDVTKRCEAEARVIQLASEDPLTCLLNRRVFGAMLEQVTKECGSFPEEQIRFAVLFIDLDRFKVINDTLGHRIGDLLLQEVARRLKWVLNLQDILARLGGDEFAIVTTSCGSQAQLENLASRLCETVSQPYEIDGHRILSSCSIGIAVGPSDGGNADELLMAADLALYAVKASGHGSYRFYERSMNHEINDRRQIEIALREAMERNELELHYQPIIDLRRNLVVGFEALARWRHPIRGMVPPSVFIPIAEDTGLILTLGEWALRTACRAAAGWPDYIRVAVNLSPVQFSTPNLCEIVESILAETGLASHRLEIEITERLLMEDNQKTVAVLHRLKKHGVRISMDDFGTGYSALSYLRNFPYDKIKIDRAFVSDLAAGTEHLVIVQAVVSIARALGMTTTAEGVETATQREFLLALGCDEAQGYFFSAPVPLNDVAGLLSRTWALAA